MLTAALHLRQRRGPNHASARSTRAALRATAPKGALPAAAPVCTLLYWYKSLKSLTYVSTSCYCAKRSTTSRRAAVRSVYLTLLVQKFKSLTYVSTWCCSVTRSTTSLRAGACKRSSPCLPGTKIQIRTDAIYVCVCMSLPAAAQVRSLS